MGSQRTRFTMSSLAVSTVMSSKNYKRFENFTHFSPSRFSGTIDKDAYGLLIHKQDKLHNLGSLGGDRLLVIDLLILLR